MIARRTHIVGAGIAGLSAALAASAAGEEVILYEGAPQAGGRCRTLVPSDGFTHDNGTHVLFTANTRTLSLLTAIGARDKWIEPEPTGLPLYDRSTGRVQRIGLSPWSWLLPSRRPRGLGLRDLACLARLVFPSQECPVASVVGMRPIMDSLVAPLTLAVLNTPVKLASTRRLAVALRRLLRPGAGRLLVARHGLTADLVAPALRTLQARGVTIQTGQRLRAVLANESRAIGLTLSDRTVALGPEDRVILALPPYEIERLMPTLCVPRAFEPILNVHYRLTGLERPRFIGFTGTLAQWALVRSDHVSVTVSAARAVIDDDADVLAGRIWREIAPALRGLGVDASPERQPEARVVKERRATIRQGTAPVPQPPLQPLSNLALAGDWLGSLPATIESAVVAGEQAVAALRNAGSAAPAPLRPHPLKREDAA